MRSRTRLLIPLIVLALVTVACGINLPNSDHHRRRCHQRGCHR